jgi:ABC-type proline/glycine betaine transport system permease subunit
MLAGWLLRGRFFRFGEVLYVGAAALARLLVAVGLGWTTFRVLKSPDVLHVGAAVVFCVLALWLALIAALMLYGLAKEGRATPD